MRCRLSSVHHCISECRANGRSSKHRRPFCAWLGACCSASAKAAGAPNPGLASFVGSCKSVHSALNPTSPGRLGYKLVRPCPLLAVNRSHGRRTGPPLDVLASSPVLAAACLARLQASRAVVMKARTAHHDGQGSRGWSRPFSRDPMSSRSDADRACDRI